MLYIIILLLSITTILAIACGIYAIINSKSIFNGSETRLSKRIADSSVLGMSASMILLSIIFIAGLLDQKFVWTFHKVLSFTLFSLIPGVLIFLGSSWKFFVVNWFRKKIKK